MYAVPAAMELSRKKYSRKPRNGAMRCHYCDCPLNKKIFEQRHCDRLFPVLEKADDTVIKVVARKAKQVAQQIRQISK